MKVWVESKYYNLSSSAKFIFFSANIFTNLPLSVRVSRPHVNSHSLFYETDVAEFVVRMANMATAADDNSDDQKPDRSCRQIRK